MSEKPLEVVPEKNQMEAASPAGKRSVNCLFFAVSAVTLLCALGVIAIWLFSPVGTPTPTPTPVPTTAHQVSLFDLQRVAKLASTEYYLVDEVQYTQIPDNVAQYLGFKREFLALVYGTVVGGFDLTDWSLEENLWQDGARVMLKLPPPQALYVDMDFERSHIVDTGGWCPVGCPEPVTDYLANVLPQAEEELKEQATEYGLLEQTARSGRDYFYYFFKSLGFGEVRIVVEGYIYE